MISYKEVIEEEAIRGMLLMKSEFESSNLLVELVELASVMT